LLRPDSRDKEGERMNNKQIVQAWARKRGYCAAVGRVSLLEDVRNSLEKRRRSGEIDAGFFRENLEAFTYLEGISLRNPRSIIIVAVPKPAFISAVSFDEEESKAFLGMKPAADGPAFDRAQAKFRELGLSEGLPAFRRNLGRLLRIRGFLPANSA